MKFHHEDDSAKLIEANSPCPHKDRCGEYEAGYCRREEFIEQTYSCGYYRLFNVFSPAFEGK